MNRIFRASDFFSVPDGTLVAPFLNSKDSMSNLPFDLLDGFSIAMGEIKSKSNSLIHLHPHVVQVIFVLSGKIIYKMKSNEDDEPYEITLNSQEAAITEKSVFSQLINPFDENCRVLYIVSPAYIFEMNEGKVIYDDAIMLHYEWDVLKKMNWQVPEISSASVSLIARGNSYKRLSER